MANLTTNVRRHEGGFVILYAVVLASLVLAVGISIISIATKQVSISGFGRESQYAFYAANTGTECALFWDFHGYLEEIAGTDPVAYARLAVFPSRLTDGCGGVQPCDEPEVPEGGVVDGVPVGRPTVRCSGTEIMSTDDDEGRWVVDHGGSGGEGDPYYNVTTFRVLIDPNDLTSACAVVTVTKTLVDEYELETTIDSRGYNTCDEASPRRVERGLEYTY